MKKNVLVALLVTLTALSARSQDAPNPPANLQTLPAGSFVIPMDNSLQSSDKPVGDYGKFNLKTYGLIVYLLNNHIKVKWSIRAGKIKDGIDFSANAELTMPTFAATAVRNFKSGPFVIFAADTAGVRSLVNSYYASQGLTNLLRPKVFRTTAATIADIRYNLSNFIPKAAILTDGGKQNIHRDYYIAAGITAQNFTIVDGFNLNGCYTFASEPHNKKTGAVVDSTIKMIKQFVLSGRNFLAQCAAVRTFENSVFGRFQTTNGFTDENENVGTHLLYPCADLSPYQFEGPFDGSSGGNLKNWKLAAGSLTNSSFNKANCTFDTSTYCFTMSKMVSGLGGLVFYVGNHRFKDDNEMGINGIRIFMNSFLTPAQSGSGCNIILPVKLVNFQGYLFNSNVKLQWTIEENEMAEDFVVETGMDGTNFTEAALIPGTPKTGSEYYEYAEPFTTEKIFYRLKMTDKSGTVTYSKILVFRNSSITDNGMRILTNPVKDILTLNFQSGGNLEVDIQVIDLAGRRVLQQKLKSYKGDNQVSILVPSAMDKGIYVVDMFDGASHRSAKFVKE